MKTLKCIAVAGCLLVVACTNEPEQITESELECTVADNPAQAKVAHNGEYTISRTAPTAEMLNGNCGEDFETGSFSGVSISSSFGPGNIILAHCVEKEALSQNPPTFGILNGWMEITGSNGDRFLASYAGDLIKGEVDTLHGEFAVSDGGGQFANSSGSGCFRAMATATDGEFNFVF